MKVETLTGHAAIISGGLGDIGRAIALELARRGADVALGDTRPPGDANSLLNELERMGRNAHYRCVDVADPAAVEAWVQDVEDNLGSATLVIPCAAIVTLKDILSVTAEEWRRELCVNLDGAFHLGRAAARRLLHHGLPGRIVFIGSWAAQAAHPHIPAYCAAKAGLRMLSRCMALELAPHGILVNEVAPGYVDAGLSGRLFDQEPGLRDEAARKVPLRKLTRPEEVAWQVAHLCDPENQQMTGSTILMDGGLSLVTLAAT